MRVTRITLKLLPSFSSARRQRSLGVVALKGGSSYLSTQSRSFCPQELALSHLGQDSRFGLVDDTKPEAMEKSADLVWRTDTKVKLTF